jgi:hypothetical protein
LIRASSFTTSGFSEIFAARSRRPAVQIEDVSRIRLTSRRPPENQGQLAIGRGLLGEIVVDTKRRLAFLVHEVLGDGAAE